VAYSFAKDLALYFVQFGVEIPDRVVRTDGHFLLVQYVARVQARRHDVYRDSRLWLAVYDGPVYVCAPPVFRKGSVMHVHESAAAKDAARQYTVIRRDDDAIGIALVNRPLDTFNAEIGKHRHIQGAGARDDVIVACSRRAGVAQEAGDSEFRRQRLQRAQGGRTDPEQQNGIHESPKQRREASEYLDESKILRRCPISTTRQYLTDL
jgi:hypothetical protein